MEKDLELNSTLWGTNGVIGRRDFFLNFLYLCMITSLLWLPAMILIAIPKAVDIEFVEITIGVLLIASAITISMMFLPNIVKRLNDINGKVNRKFNVIYTVTFILSILLTIFFHSIFSLIIIGFFIHLFGKKGQITGKNPYNIIKSFNWGAYFGTWIWGLFNKSYKTLWIIPLSITPLGFIFQLICGMKGNEWASENKDWESLEQFKESQITQTIVFTILNLVVFPIVLTILIMAITFGFVFSTIDDVFKNPKKADAKIERLENAISKFSSFYFEKYEITSNENKYYILPNTWRYASFKERTDMLELAANLAATERRKEKKDDKCCSYSKTTELPRTKIYNVKNNELLAEFCMDEAIYKSEQVNFKDVLKASFKAYKFYEPTY